MSDDNEPLLSRWSKRKLAKEVEPEANLDVLVDEESAPDPEREAELLANLEAAEAVDLETLDEKSDISIFMKDGVPELLKRRAMAALWRSSPVFANVDGLVDYDDDFGSPDLIMKTFQSAWQVGRGYLKNTEEDGEAEDETVSEAKDDDDDPSPDETGDVTVAADTSLESSIDPKPVEAQPEELDEPEPVALPRVSLRRRLMLEDEA